MPMSQSFPHGSPDGGITMALSLTFFLLISVVVLTSLKNTTTLLLLRKNFQSYAFIVQNSLFLGSANGTLIFPIIMAFLFSKENSTWNGEILTKFQKDSQSQQLKLGSKSMGSLEILLHRQTSWPKSLMPVPFLQLQKQKKTTSGLCNSLFKPEPLLRPNPCLTNPYIDLGNDNEDDCFGILPPLQPKSL